MIASVSETIQLRLYHFGQGILFSVQIFQSAFKQFKGRVGRKELLHSIIESTAYILVSSTPIILISGSFIGAILVVQFNQILVQYDAQILLGGLNSSALIRQVGPLILSFNLAGKVGASIASELATMRVTDQLDAIDCLGTDSVIYVVAPKYFAIIISSLLLLGMALLFSIFGSMLVSDLFFGINPIQFLSTAPRFVSVWTLYCGFIQSLVYGGIIASTAVYFGYHAKGGAAGVGRAVMSTASVINLLVVIFNHFLGVLLNAIHNSWLQFHQ